jgi:hypothetical protein
LASHDQQPLGSDLPRSLSEQLRLLEQQLNRMNAASARPAQTMLEPFGQPMSLGRPLGVAPTLGVPDPYPDDEDDTPAPARSTFRRRAVIGGTSLLLLSATAIVPSVWHFAAPGTVPQATSLTQPSIQVALRTDQFSHAARDLAQMSLLPPAAPESSLPAPAAPVVLPVPAPSEPTIQESRAPAGTSPPPTRLTVAESDLQRVSLPMLVSGGGPSWAGSAVIIDGLPSEARVSHGMKIAPDTWTVGIDDVNHAVLSLPPTTPDRLELAVRVLAPNSHELASSALQIHVVRTSAASATVAPAAIFEPAAAETANGPSIEPPLPISRQAVKVQRTKRPDGPPKPPVTQQVAQEAKQPSNQSERPPAAASAWVSTVLPPVPLPTPAPTPKWSPFNDQR